MNTIWATVESGSGCDQGPAEFCSSSSEGEQLSELTAWNMDRRSCGDRCLAHITEARNTKLDATAMQASDGPRFPCILDVLLVRTSSAQPGNSAPGDRQVTSTEQSSRITKVLTVQLGRAATGRHQKLSDHALEGR
jgi:hypothetical protein